MQPFDLKAFDIKKGGNDEFDFFGGFDGNNQEANQEFFGNIDNMGANDFSLGDFGDPEDMTPHNQSNVSKLFNVQKPQSNDFEGSANRSRHLDDISFEGDHPTANGFVYSKDMPIKKPSKDEEFSRLMNQVKQTRQKNLNDFFKQLSESNKQGPNDSFLKRKEYSNHEEFEEYIRNLKLEKRRREEQHQKQAQFQVNRPSRQPEFSKKQLPVSYQSNSQSKSKEESYNKAVPPKKNMEFASDSFQSQSGSYSNQPKKEISHIKPAPPSKSMFDDFDFNELQKSTSIKKDNEIKASYASFDSRGSQPIKSREELAPVVPPIFVAEPLPPPKLDSQKKLDPVPVLDPLLPLRPSSGNNILELDLANNEFDESKVPTSNYQPPKLQTPSAAKLAPIREENSNIFEKTIEQQKLTKLFQNFQKMKDNYDALIKELKTNTQGQQRIISEFGNLKQQYKHFQDLAVRQLEEQRNLRMHAIDDKQLKILELKKQLQTIKKQEKTTLQKQICDRIASLEEVVKKSFQELNSDKKEIMVWVNPEVGKQQSLPSGPPTDRSEPIKFEQKMPDENNYASRRTVKQDLKQSTIQEVYSPLQLRLDNCNNLVMSPHSPSETHKVHSFHLSPKTYSDGEQHRPRNQHFDVPYKVATIKDHSVIYQSFDFIVNCKYSSVKSNNRKVMKMTVSVRNKTILTLLDLIVIVYGSVGQALSVNPAKIYMQKLASDELLTFQIFLSNIVFDSQHVNMQMSYRSQAMAKKKIQIRIPRPITKFFDVQFTHEDQYRSIWKSLTKELYIQSKLLNFKEIRSSEDLKILLPFIEVVRFLMQLTEENESQFSYGILFNLFNIEGIMLLKLLCSTDGRASLHVRYENDGQRRYAEEVLENMNGILYS